MICGECGRQLASDDFYASNQARCKACVKAAVKARRRQNPMSQREAAAAYRHRQRLRLEVMEYVIRQINGLYPETLLDAVFVIEDTLELEPNTVLTLLYRPMDASSRKASLDRQLENIRRLVAELSETTRASAEGESTTDDRDEDAA